MTHNGKNNKMSEYNFNPELAYETIRRHFTEWCNVNHIQPKAVIGISGGKDSTVVAWLMSKIIGAHNVHGVLMPCGEQKDIYDSEEVVYRLGIHSYTYNIGPAFEEFKKNLLLGHMSNDAIINLPPRLRMSTLYAVAQSIGGIVMNTSNLTEDILGYATLWGDSVGSYAPIQQLTVTEVIKLGEWLGVPDKLIHKVPADGLQDKTDEDRLGLKYADVDKLIRLDEGTDELRKKTLNYFNKNLFKIKMINMEGPKFTDLPNTYRKHIANC